MPDELTQNRDETTGRRKPYNEAQWMAVRRQAFRDAMSLEDVRAIVRNLKRIATNPKTKSETAIAAAKVLLPYLVGQPATTPPATDAKPPGDPVSVTWTVMGAEAVAALKRRQTEPATAN